MGDVVVSVIVNEIVRRLTYAAVKEFDLLREAKSDILALGKSFETIQAVLQDAEAKQRKEKAVEVWLRRLRCASFKMENVLDEVSTHAMLRRLDAERGFKHRAGAFFSSHHNPLQFRVRIARTVKHLRKELDVIAAERSKYDLTCSAGVGVGADMLSSRLTSSLVYESEVYGRVEERRMITKIICKHDIINRSGDDVRVYAIWGMGGVGKTTLAQLVYNDQRVKTYFNLKAWVCVSDDFDALRLTRAIIESLEGNPCTLSQLDSLQIRLQDTLRGKKFFFVLDDVWNEDRTKWDALRRGLDCGAEGSMVVLVTTRSRTIATMMAKQSKFMHQMGCLSKEHSWALFSQLAFGVGREGSHARELEPIGRDIMEKCKGLPLAVKALGSLMWSKSSIREWQVVKESEIWDLPDDGSSILPALKLSYDNLPPHVKQCFAFCCVFPKDYLISKYSLILFWIGNGFVPSRGEVDLYVLGEEIFNCLLWRSFFQDAKHRNYGYPHDLPCKMHDLMHDLARSVMGYECSFIEPGTEFKNVDALLHFHSSWSNYLPQDLKMLRSVRTILIDDEDKCSIPHQITSHKFLRVLDWKYSKVKKLPQSISYLKHLRYLNISHSNIKVLPESIIYLQNLQGLHLKDCFRLCKLPEGMRYMRNLHYLDLHGCVGLQHFPIRMGQLRNLRLLSKFFVGKKNGYRIEELGDMDHLAGELEIMGLDNVGGLKDAESANLKRKQNLTTLSLQWNGTKMCKVHEEVLKGLEPPSNLYNLYICMYQGRNFSPSWLDNLRNLVQFQMYICREFQCLPPLGKLPCLKTIRLSTNDSLNSFHDDDLVYLYDATSGEDNILFSHLQTLEIVGSHKLIKLPSNLPKLEKLELEKCNGIVSLPDPNGMPRVKSISIKKCLNLTCLPNGMENLKALNSLKIIDCQHLQRRCSQSGEDWPKISHIPLIVFD